jgi:hypothetical protein
VSRRVPRPSAGTGAIRSASIGAERVRTMAASQSGCEMKKKKPSKARTAQTRILKKTAVNLQRGKNADFAIEIDFVRDSPDPARVFRSMTQLIDTFQRFDRELVRTIDVNIQPILLLQNVEAGSLISWLRGALESVDDTALKDGDWKKLVGHYLVKAKYLTISFLSKRTEIKDKDELAALQGEILAAAEETGVKRIPAYTSPSGALLVRTISDVANSLAVLRQGDHARFQTREGNSVEFNLSIRVVPETLNQLLIERSLANEQVMILKVKKPDFLGDSRWEFIHESIFETKVLDDEWLRSFRNNDFSLQPGSAIRALVRVEVGYGYEREIVSHKREIIKVFEVVPPPPHDQSALQLAE